MPYLRWLVTGFPQQQPRFDHRSGQVGFWWTKWHWGWFSLSTSVSLGNSNSTNCSIFINLTITEAIVSILTASLNNKVKKM
jgi:hypothetical protein